MHNLFKNLILTFFIVMPIFSAERKQVKIDVSQSGMWEIEESPINKECESPICDKKIIHNIIKHNYPLKKLGECLKNKKHIGIRFDNGDTPLILAIKLGRLRIVKMFLEDGHELYTKNNDGFNALDIARQMLKTVSTDTSIKNDVIRDIYNEVEAKMTSCIIS